MSTTPVSAPCGGANALSRRADFYRAWQMVNSAEQYSPPIRARAFSVWVALFGCVTDDGVVTRNSAEVAEEFEVSRASWLQYRELLESVGLIEQERVPHGSQRPTIVRLHPPLHTD